MLVVRDVFADRLAGYAHDDRHGKSVAGDNDPSSASRPGSRAARARVAHVSHRYFVLPGNVVVHSVCVAVVEVRQLGGAADWLTAIDRRAWRGVVLAVAFDRDCHADDVLTSHCF